MRSLVASALICLFFAHPVAAEVVRIRSGEHASFSRLVLEFAEPTPWAITETETGYLVELRRDDLQFDLQQVFRLIPRDRLSDLMQGSDPGTLRLTLNCECHAEAFNTKPTVLVIDIKDGPPAAPDTELRSDETLGNSGDAPSQPVVPLTIKPRPLVVIGNFPAPASAQSVLPETTETADSNTERVRAAAEEDRARELQRMMLEQLGRAAAQGLIKANLRPRPSIPTEEKRKPTPADTPEPPSEPLVIGEFGHPGVRIETSIDQAGAERSKPAVTARGTACLPAHWIDLAAWGDPEQSSSDLISSARGQLVGEFDQVSETALRNAVRTNLFLGFGAEALALMKAFDVTLPERAVLVALAEIMDTGSSGNPAIFQGQLACDSPAALWAALAAIRLPRGEDVNTDALVGAFSALPLHLRRHLAPDLARRLLDVGDKQTAGLVRNAVARAAGAERDVGLSLTEARLTLADGDSNQAEPLLANAAAQNDPRSPEALLALLEAQLSSGKVPSSDSILMAEALAHERQGTDLGQRLFVIAIRAKARAGRFAEAFAEIEDLAEDQALRLQDDLVAELVDHGDDITFLSHMLDQPDHAGHSQALAESIARRFLDLGFPKAAMNALPDRPGSEPLERRLLRAEIANSLGEFGTTLELLQGMEGPAAATVRAKAYRQAEDLAAAESELASAGLTPERIGLAWQAGDWATVAKLGSEPQRNFSMLRQKRSEQGGSSMLDGTDTPDVVTIGRNLLEQSAEARAAVSALLSPGGG